MKWLFGINLLQENSFGLLQVKLVGSQVRVRLRRVVLVLLLQQLGQVQLIFQAEDGIRDHA